MRSPDPAPTTADPDRRAGLDLLLSPGFLLALGCLALNDHVLKAQYGNWLTGKLSDVAGLFAFALFLTAVHPRRPALAAAAAGALFVWWKSPLAEVVIEAWNGLGLWHAGRVLDYSDWGALLVLPLAHRYAGRAAPVARLRHARPLVAVLSVVLFAATSAPREVLPIGAVYVLPQLPDRVRAQLDSLAGLDSAMAFRLVGGPPDTVALRLTWDADALLELRAADTGETLVTLLELEVSAGGSVSPEYWRQQFRTRVIVPLRAETVGPRADR